MPTKKKSAVPEVLPFPKRLRRAAELWGKMQKVVTDKSNLILKAWAADYFNSNIKSIQSAQNHSVNLLDRAMTILLPYLVMSNPRVNVDAVLHQYRPFARTTELALNQWIHQFKLARNTLYPLCRNSLISMGIVKTGVMKKWQVEIFGNSYDVGDIYSDVVDPSDWVCDPSCKTIRDASFVGNYFYLPTEFAQEFYGSKHADHIKPSVDLFGELSPRKLAAIQEVDADPKFLKPLTRFVEYYLPDENVIITQLAEGEYTRFLREVDWKGPEGGPYDVLGYKWFPEYPIPIPPAWGWLDMDSMFNIIVNKIKQQAASQKSVLAYEGEAAQDAERIADAGDRQTVKVDHIDSLKQLEFGGVNESMYNFLGWLQGQWSEQGGNLHVLGGRQAEADTLGQEQMLMGNASRSLEYMLQAVYEVTESLTNKFAYYLWTDPLVDIPVIKEIKGVATFEEHFSKQNLKGAIDDYMIKIQPMSMQRPTADGQFQRLIQFISQWLLPTLPIASQQGIELDVAEATQKLAKLAGINDLELFFKPAVPQEAKLNPYNPQALGSGMEDGRTGMMGAASRNANMIQQQSRAGGQPSPPQK